MICWGYDGADKRSLTLIGELINLQQINSQPAVAAWLPFHVRLLLARNIQHAATPGPWCQWSLEQRISSMIIVCARHLSAPTLSSELGVSALEVPEIILKAAPAVCFGLSPLTAAHAQEPADLPLVKCARSPSTRLALLASKLVRLVTVRHFNPCISGRSCIRFCSGLA